MLTQGIHSKVEEHIIKRKESHHSGDSHGEVVEHLTEMKKALDRNFNDAIEEIKEKMVETNQRDFEIEEKARIMEKELMMGTKERIRDIFGKANHERK